MNNRLSIKQAVTLSGLSENYIRKAIASGKLVAVKETIGESKIEKNWIEADVFEAWRASAGTHSRREDGRNKFVLYMNADEAEALQALIDSGDFTGLVSRANQKAETE
jgi:hypothetical protein